MSPPDLKMPNMLLEKNRGELLIATESMKRLGQSGNGAQLWMCLMMKVKSYAVNNSILYSSSIGTWNAGIMNQGKLDMV